MDGSSLVYYTNITTFVNMHMIIRAIKNSLAARKVTNKSIGLPPTPESRESAANASISGRPRSAPEASRLDARPPVLEGRRREDGGRARTEGRLILRGRGLALGIGGLCRVGRHDHLLVRVRLVA